MFVCVFFETLGKKMLVPLTASLYVPGMLDDEEKVLVDIGTGYFVEVVDLDYYSLKLSFDALILPYPKLISFWCVFVSENHG